MIRKIVLLSDKTGNQDMQLVKSELRGLKPIHCNSKINDASIGFPSNVALCNLQLENLLIYPFCSPPACYLRYFRH
jgi:hypothetical protein